MEGQDLDTETLLAILSSLLHPLEFEHPVLLDALVKSQGDVEAAAASLRSEPPRKKRKVEGKAGLQGWLNGSKKSGKLSSPAKPLSAAAPLASSSTTIDKPTSRGATGSAARSDVHDADKASASPSKKPKSQVKTVTNTEFMALFRPPNSSDDPSKPQIIRHPPLTLVSSELVAQHTPCTLHNSILPQELACRCVVPC